MKKIFALSSLLLALGLASCDFQGFHFEISVEGDSTSEVKNETSEEGNPTSGEESPTSEAANPTSEAENPTSEEVTSEGDPTGFETSENVEPSVGPSIVEEVEFMTTNVGGWNEDALNAIVSVIGVTIPYFSGFDSLEVYVSAWPEDDVYYAGFEIGYESEDDIISDSNYLSLLEQDGFQYVDLGDEVTGYGKLVNSNDLILVDAYFYEYDPDFPDWPSTNIITGSFYSDIIEAEESSDIGPVNPQEGSVISFADDSFMLSAANANQTVWGVGNYTFTLDKGSASVDVGNANYFSNPLRIYQGQVGTIAWEDEIDCVILEVKTAQKSSADNFSLVSGAYEPEIVKGDGIDTITIVPLADSSSIVFTVSTKQVHLNSIAFVE